MTMRIVSLAPSNTEILFALGAGEEVVARTAFCDWPLQARELPVAGSWLTISSHQIERFKPDLVLTSTFLQDGIASSLRRAGYHVVHVDPRTVPEVLASIRKIGYIIGRPAQGEHLAHQIEGGFSALSASSATAPHPPRVYIEEWHAPPMASGNWVPELVEYAGGVSLLEPGEPSREVSLDEVHAFDPDLAILSICGRGSRVSPDLLASRDGWAILRPVRTPEIYVFDDSLLNRPGPRLLEGAQALKAILDQISLQ